MSTQEWFREGQLVVELLACSCIIKELEMRRECVDEINIDEHVFRIDFPVTNCQIRSHIPTMYQQNMRGCESDLLAWYPFCY